MFSQVPQSCVCGRAQAGLVAWGEADIGAGLVLVPSIMGTCGQDLLRASDLWCRELQDVTLAWQKGFTVCVVIATSRMMKRSEGPGRGTCPSSTKEAH